MHASPYELQLIISLPCMWAIADVETFNTRLLAFLEPFNARLLASLGQVGGGPPSSPLPVQDGIRQDELAGWGRLQGALHDLQHDLQLDLDLDASVPPTSTIYFSNATMLSIGASRALRCSLPQSSAASAAATAAGSADSAAGGEGGGAAAGDLVTPAPNRTQTALQLQSAFDAVANSRDVEATGGYTRLGHTSGGSGSGSRVKHLGAPTRD